METEGSGIYLELGKARGTILPNVRLRRENLKLAY